MLQHCRNVEAIFFERSGSPAQLAASVAESMRITPYGLIPSSRSFLAILQDFLTCSINRCRSSAPPMADPPPVGGQTGATTDPTRRFLEAILAASSFNSSSVESILVC